MFRRLARWLPKVQLVTRALDVADKYAEAKQEEAKSEQQLYAEMRALRQEVRNSNSFWQKFIGGILAGFGTVIGATLVVAFLIYLLTQLASIEWLKPLVEEIVKIVDRTKK
jgi:hypothetical protein